MMLKCREYFKCKKTECPAYKAYDMRCWLQCGTHCHEEIQGTWLEKMGACIKCKVFTTNFHEKDSHETISLISSQFEDYKRRVSEKTEQLEKAKKKLVDFKITSVYLLKELDKKSNELLQERKNLEKRVQEKTKELRDIQTQLVQSAKMAAMGKFSAGIAHEINNPLAGILNCVRSLLGTPEIKGEKRGYLELILKGLLRIENTISQVLSFSGRQGFEPRLIDINQLIKEALAFANHKLLDKKITLRQNMSELLPPVLVDPHQIQQVFMNVIANALDALPSGGRLSVITVSKGSYIDIKFTDNGKGIKQEDLDKIFDPFYTTKEVGKGVGLGLSITYTIIQQHNGKIDIKSKENEGTAVTITLPIAAEIKNKISAG